MKSMNIRATYKEFQIQCKRFLTSYKEIHNNTRFHITYANFQITYKEFHVTYKEFHIQHPEIQTWGIPNKI